MTASFDILRASHPRAWSGARERNRANPLHRNCAPNRLKPCLGSPHPNTANAALEKRLWDAADQFRANSGLKSRADQLVAITVASKKTARGDHD